MVDIDRVLVQVRLPKALVRHLDHVAIDRDVRRGVLIEVFLRQALAALGGEGK